MHNKCITRDIFKDNVRGGGGWSQIRDLDFFFWEGGFCDKKKWWDSHVPHPLNKPSRVTLFSTEKNPICV